MNKDVAASKQAPVVQIFEDFRCPICGVLEGVQGPTFQKLAEAGKIKFYVNLKTVIDSNTGGTSSQEAANAALCAADQGAWWPVHKYLFANQPAEPNPFPADAFSAAGKSAGLNATQQSAYSACVTGGNYLNYVKEVDTRSSSEGVNGTPYLFVNGVSVNWQAIRDDTAKMEQILTSGKVPTDLVQPNSSSMKISAP